MTSRDRSERLGLGGALSKLTGLVVISVVTGLLVAGLAMPFLALGRVTAEAVVTGTERLPAALDTDPLPQRSRVLDRHGNLIARFYDEYRINVPLQDIAPVMSRALIAIEDARFYDHRGVDLKGTIRALVNNQIEGGVVQGGSSITQQLVKMTRAAQADTPEERAAALEETYHRKFTELRYAMALEKNRGKEWILERYLNLAYFGDGAYGVEAAARHYFSRSASKLKLRHAALLAGLVKNPTRFDPTNRPDRAQLRRNVVLNRMAELGMVTRDRAERVKAKELGLKISPARNGCLSSKAPFFCAYVREYLLQDDALGDTKRARREALTTGGLTIKTTLDLRFQRAADRSVREHVHATDRAVGALAMVRPGTGAVRAVAQSRPMGANKRKGQTFLNYAVPRRYGDSRGFQAGSTFKVFVLAAAIDQGVPLTTRIRAPQQVSIPVNRYRGCRGRLISDDRWEPNNSTGAGTFNLYRGTQQSVNTFFAQLELRTGLCQPYRLAKRMGIELNDPDSQQVPSFTLGVVNTNPLAMAEAYATFAARGVHCDPRPVTWVRDKEGEVVKKYRNRCQRVLRAPVADAVNDVLRGVQQPGGFGHNAGITLDQPSAGKTGTINRNMAVWFVGYTPTMATAAMIAGADRNGHWVTLNGQTVGGSPIFRAAGSTNAGPMWGNAMKAVQHLLPDRNFTRPDPRVVRGMRVRVPDVVGLTFASAARRLQKAGLLAEATEGGRTTGAARVTATRPAPGTQVESGSNVTLLTGSPD